MTTNAPTIRTLTADELREEIDDPGGKIGVVDLINRWLARGDGVAVFENVDLGHPMIGHKIFLSYGSEAAQLPDEPERGKCCPVSLERHGLMNWRYYPYGLYRGEEI